MEKTALEIRIHISFNTIKYVLYHLHYTSEYACLWIEYTIGEYYVNTSSIRQNLRGIFLLLEWKSKVGTVAL
jgi:hypothetical protein